MRLLAKRPEERPASASEVRRVIETSTDLGRADMRYLVGNRARLWLMLRRLAMFGVAALIILTAVVFWAETSGRTSFVNAFMGAKSGKYLYIVGRWGTYDSICAAVNAAHPNDIIEVRTNTPATGSGGLRMRAGKPLTIRGARGFQPTLHIPSAGWPAVGVVESALTMEGFVVMHTYRGMRAGRLLLAKGAPLTFVNCRFVRQQRPASQMNTTGHALFALQDSPGIEMVNCEIYAPGSPLIGIVSDTPDVATKVTLRNSILWGAVLWCDDKAPDRLEVEVERCELLTNGLLNFKHAMPTQSLSVRVTGSVIQTYNTMLRVPWPLEKLREVITWEGGDNLFFVPEQMALAQNGRVKTLEDWRRFKPGAIMDAGSLFADQIAAPYSAKAFAQIGENGQPLRISVPKEAFPADATLPTAGPSMQKMGPFVD
jgi:hypothetical protein